MKLKTLKDFEPHETHWHPDEDPTVWEEIKAIDIKELRSEAIKWTKALIKTEEKSYSGELIFCFNCCKGIEIKGSDKEKSAERKKHNYPKVGKSHNTIIREDNYDEPNIDEFSGAITALKHFFNISEEELK